MTDLMQEDEVTEEMESEVYCRRGNKAHVIMLSGEGFYFIYKFYN